MDPGICLSLNAARPAYQNAADLMTYSVSTAWGGGPTGNDPTVLLAKAWGQTVVTGQETTFSLSWTDDPYWPSHKGTPGSRLRWTGWQFDVSNAADRDDASGGDMQFVVDFVDGCWFALNNVFRNQVADIQGSSKHEKTPIIAFPSNGGHNQIWRAQKL